MKHLKNINSFIKESKNMNLLLTFSDDDNYQKATKYFDEQSELYSHDYSNEYRTLYFDCSSQQDCDATEKALEIELIENDIENYRFEIE